MSSSAQETLALPEWLTRLSLEEIKDRLAQGSLLASLQKDLRGGGRDALVGVRLAQEGYESESSFLILLLELKNPAAQSPYEKEVVLQYPHPGDPPSNRPIRSWCYPDDPWLPSLARMDRGHAFLDDTAWEKPWKRIFPQDGEISVQRLLYNPGRRATFLLSSPKSGAKLILKAIRSSDFEECLARVEAIQGSSLCDRITLPTLFSYSIRENAFLYEYLPGRRIDRFQADGASQIRPYLLEAVAGIASEIHQTAIPQLPRWSPQMEADTARNLLGRLEAHYPAASTAIRPLFERLFRGFVEGARSYSYSYSYMIHNSFSAKHIFCHAGGLNSLTPVSLAIIDWDSAVLGPREKDLGSFLAGFPDRKEECRLFLDRYQERAGCVVELKLVNCFLQYRRLLKACRQILRQGDADETSVNALREIEDRLDHNPLVG
ncbi:MAG: phosphotransferase [Candidatus Tectomicrobia bacterium]|uniref:Phosphotransferase n=1 Tax=Tectimicrobiota bacterium TaxID=2528274 RepID=A0A932CLY7_UNCTE|nr:phosphotransferase [Candidatus Tectomicrobia bacterium]